MPICPRIKHFVRLEANGKIGKCGHMTNVQEFDSFDEMQNSEWLKEIDNKSQKHLWPSQCTRCRLSEETTGTSVRLDAIERDRILKAIDKNYIIVGGTLDNVCNSACISCNELVSTKIGSLKSKNYKIVNNFEKFFELPQENIVEVDISGGEPTASPNYKKLLKTLPNNTMIVRINTNGSKIIPEVEHLLKNKKRIIITLSFDGVEGVHDYARWPIKWTLFKENVNRYIRLRSMYSNLRLNFWTTLSCLNVLNLDEILAYAQKKKIDHSYGFCVRPEVLDIRYKNFLTDCAVEKLSNSKNETCQQILKKIGSLDKDNSNELKVFLNEQDRLRNISYKDYLNF